VFAEHGYDATSVEEIAEQAGVSKPIVYEHFGGKEGLYAVIVDRETGQVVGSITLDQRSALRDYVVEQRTPSYSLPGDIRVDKDVPFNKIPTKGR